MSLAPTSTHSSASAQLGLGHIALPRRGRGLCVGMTESGKSTLAERLIADWRQQYGAQARVLIIDSKPRFRAETQLSGLSAKPLYKHWDHGAAVPGSYRLDLANPSAELKGVWRYGGQVAIAQGPRQHLPWLKYAADRFYNDSRAKYAQLLYVDELADFYDSTGHSSAGDPFLQAVRSGRERGVSVLAASQRPRAIPKSVITELTNLYLFDLAYDKDLEHLQEMGLHEPVDMARIRRNPHSFYFFSRKEPGAAGYYRLGGIAA